MLGSEGVPVCDRPTNTGGVASVGWREVLVPADAFPTGGDGARTIPARTSVDHTEPALPLGFKRYQPVVGYPQRPLLRSGEPAS